LKDGRLHTGDLATVDEDGYIYIVGRASNIIKSAGYRISPKEVDDIINTIDGILGCVVVGVPDDIMGEAVGAVVQAPDDRSVDLKREILALCNKKLPSYKVPKYVIRMEEFPLNDQQSRLWPD
jgi:acyl-coenzyme A synthetase/AMP-(fatty) acid ligase